MAEILLKGKCNLLKPVDSVTGTFFSFSQYAQSLTKQYTNCDNYRCVPSKFLAFDIKVGDKTEKDIGEIFQNYFENACTVMRCEHMSNPDINQEMNPSRTLNMLMSTLRKYEFIEESNVDVNSNEKCFKELKYIGDINIYSYNPTSDGVGYSEIYCYMPNDACANRYFLGSNKDLVGDVDIQNYYIDTDEEYIRGFENATISSTLTYKLESETNTLYYDTNGTEKYYTFVKDNIIPRFIYNDDTDVSFTRSDEEVDKFTFNTIVVLYDVVKKDITGENDICLYSNIPLGIWFTGKPEDGKLTNSITKFVNNEEIYNQGTSYGLRICNRFLCSPLLTEFISSEAVTSLEYENITQALNGMADTISSFNKLYREINEMNTDIDKALLDFRNNKTNVPYIKQIGSSKYWFVNGYNTGVEVSGEVNQATNDRIDELESSINSINDELNNNINNYLNTYITNNPIIEQLSEQDVENIVREFETDLTHLLGGDDKRIVKTTI